MSNNNYHNDFNWESFYKERHKLYHSPKNKEILPVVIFFSLICIILKDAIAYEIIIWFAYYQYCKSNNEKLNKNPEIIQMRKVFANIQNKQMRKENKNKK